MLFRAHGRFVESLGRPVRDGRGRGHEPERHGLRAHGDRLRGRPRGPVGRPVAGDGARRLPRDPGVGARALGLGRPRGPHGVAPGVRPRGLLPREGARRRRRQARGERHRPGQDQARGGRDRRQGGRADEIYGVQADIFAPCALGGIINDETLPQLRVEIVAGGANNQLLEPRHGDRLEEMGLLYAPDYVANAGGVINVYSELAGWDRERSLRKADEIYDTILGVFEIAGRTACRRTRRPTAWPSAASRPVRSMVRTWPQWPNKAERVTSPRGAASAPRADRSTAPRREDPHMNASRRWPAALSAADPEIAAPRRARDGAAERRARADRERELRLARGARGDGLAAHEQVRRGAPRASGTTAAARSSTRSSRSRSTARRSCSAPSTRTCSRTRARRPTRRVPRLPQAGRHLPRHGPVERRAPHARLAGELLGDDLQAPSRTA
jgi:hypothetical protein